jgi:cytochrome c oxidase assembly protein subunit 11
MSQEIDKKNAKLVRTLVFVVIGMFGFGFALVPLYDVLCDITGLNGKVGSKAVKEVTYQVDQSREVTVEFMTAVNESTPMVFRAETNKLKVHPGEYYRVNFYAENMTNEAMVAQAIPSISQVWLLNILTRPSVFVLQSKHSKPVKIKSCRYGLW